MTATEHDAGTQTGLLVTSEPAIETRTNSRRVLFYSHDGTGLGHLRITLGVATAYASLRPTDSLLLLTGSLQASAFDLPENLDYIKFPAMPKRDIYESLPPTDGFTGSHNSTIRFRSALALATVKGFDPDLVVVDHAPGGLFRELAPSIEWLRQRDPRPRFALLMRDVTFGPAQTRSIWQGEGVYPYLDEVYDRILIYGDKRVFDPISAYGMSEAAAERTRFCGYLAPLPPRRSPMQVRQELQIPELPLVAVSVGGGHDGGPLLRAYLDGLRKRGDHEIASYIVTGPLLPGSDRQFLRNLAADLPNTRITDFDADFAAAVQAADVVVCMGGYNSVAEAVHFGKRPVVVPRLPGPEEQVIRAEGFARLGLASVVSPASLSTESLWDAIDAALFTSAPPAQNPGFDGLANIARELSELSLG